MRKPFLVLVVFCLAATLAVAQAAPPASVCEIHVNKPKPGMTSQYEQGRTKHMAWHKSQNDSWTWHVWEITTGPDTGSYLVSSCGHEWKDFDGRDKFNLADSVDANANMGPSLASSTMSYYVLRADLSAPMAAGPTPPYLSVTHFFLKPEGALDFFDGAKKVGAALTKTGTPSPPTEWYSLVNGGRGPELVLAQARKSIGDLAGPAKTLDQIMQEAYGAEGATTMSAIRKAYYSAVSELLQLRPELSYVPAKKP
jgi:hypothetical protein